MHTAKIDGLFTGTVQPFGPAGELSAIRKEPRSDRVYLGVLGLDGDEHAYPSHGGADKALFHYASEHYTSWRRMFTEFVLIPSGFGENLAGIGMTEKTVCIGDRYRIGKNVVVEVSQPRQPCWKLGFNAGIRDIPRLMQELANPGWYYRVVETGPIAAGDYFTLLDRPHANWPVARVVSRFYSTPLDTAFLQAITKLAVLGAEWRTLATRRLETGQTEDWDGRLYGGYPVETFPTRSGSVAHSGADRSSIDSE